MSPAPPPSAGNPSPGGAGGGPHATPLVSVVIPAYNQAQFLGATVGSVLAQTYSHLELIVVSDASPDETADVVKRFDDPRVRLIEHERNRGLPATRNTGMRASKGAIIALLDADDQYHPEKLATHVAFLERHPEVGVTYNPRFNLHHSSEAVRDIWRPPLEVGLSDFVLGFPFSPSDMVLRRDWAFRAGLFDERLFSGGEDLDFPCRLALAGCRFASVDRALNYRRYHAGRRKRNLPARLQDYRDALDTAFSDPRCPDSVKALRDRAYTNHHLEVIYLAFSQEEGDVGQAWLREALRLSPDLTEGSPSRLMRYLVGSSIADDRQDHGRILRAVLDQMPPECSGLRAEYDWAVQYGRLLKDSRRVIWSAGDGDAATPGQAAAWRSADEAYVTWAAGNLASYETEHGIGSANAKAARLAAELGAAGARSHARALTATYLVDRAFRSFRTGRRDLVPATIARAAGQHPSCLANRGVLSIFLRSVVAGRRGEATRP